MPGRPSLAIVLAAGEGTRMRSDLPKVLHRAGGRTLLAHVLAAVRDAGIEDAAVVVGPSSSAVEQQAAEGGAAARIFVQADRRGTAHAVLAARAAIDAGQADLVVLFGDTPLVRPATISAMREQLAAGAAVAVVAFRAADPSGYGRVVLQGGEPASIREERDATDRERALDLCNAGMMGIAGRHALELLDAVGDDNAKREFYLTDIVGMARRRGLPVRLVEADEREVQGVNTRAQLAAVEAAFQARYRAAALDAGVTLVAPETVFLAPDTAFGRDVVVEPYVVFGSGVRVGDGAQIRAFSHLDGAEIGPGAVVGPYARLRPGAKLGAGVHIGNFVEIKNATLADGAKANHLAYVGDATVGEAANIGAGAITCNYDGIAKHRTVIGARAFIGTNASLVAPLTVGDGAYVGSGSVITSDVPAEALALGRARQVVKAGRAAEIRVAAAGKATP